MANWKLKIKHNNADAGVVPVTLRYTTLEGAEILKTVNVAPTEISYNINEFAVDGNIDIASISYGKIVETEDKTFNITGIDFGGGETEAEEWSDESYSGSGSSGEVPNDFIPSKAQVDAVANSFKNRVTGLEPTWAAFDNTPEWAVYDMKPDIEYNNTHLLPTPNPQSKIGVEVHGGIFCSGKSGLGAVYFNSMLLGTSLPYYAFLNYSRVGGEISLQSMNVEGRINGWHMYGYHLVDGRVFGQSLKELAETDTVYDLSNGATNTSILTISFAYDYYPMSTGSVPPTGKFYVDDIPDGSNSAMPVNSKDCSFIRVKLANGPHRILGVPKKSMGITPVTFGVHTVTTPHYSCNQLMIVAMRGYPNCRANDEFKAIKVHHYLYNQALERNFMQPNSLFEMAVNNPSEFEALKNSLKWDGQDD